MVIVYAHRKKTSKEIFYIGIGSIKRSRDRWKRSEFWNKIVNKHDYIIEILYKNLTWEEACDKEIELISFYGRRDLNTGILCNHTDGGEGSPNCISTGRKCVLQYDLNGNFIKE